MKVDLIQSRRVPGKQRVVDCLLFSFTGLDNIFRAIVGQIRRGGAVL